MLHGGVVLARRNSRFAGFSRSSKSAVQFAVFTSRELAALLTLRLNARSPLLAKPLQFPGFQSYSMIWCGNGFRAAQTANTKGARALPGLGERSCQSMAPLPVDGCATDVARQTGQ